MVTRFVSCFLLFITPCHERPDIMFSNTFDGLLVKYIWKHLVIFYETPSFHLQIINFLSQSDLRCVLQQIHQTKHKTGYKSVEPRGVKFTLIW